MSQRAKHFKAGVGRDEARRGRNETQVQIRKEKKEDRLNQRRRKGLEASGGGGLFGFGAAQEETPSTTMGASATVVDAGTQMRVSWMQHANAYFVQYKVTSPWLDRGCIQLALERTWTLLVPSALSYPHVPPR